MDAIVSGLFTRPDKDPFGSAKKLNAGAWQSGELDGRGLLDYVRPFAGNATRWRAARHVVLHDSPLPEGVAVPGVEFVRMTAPEKHDNYEARFFAFRDWLAANPDVERVWFVDVNDAVFTTDPFRWLDDHCPDGIAAGEEWNPYGDSQWFRDAWSLIPSEYGALMGGPFKNRHAVSCGTIGGLRGVLLDVLDEMCVHLGRMRDHLDATRPKGLVMTDMNAFAFVALPRTDLVTFKMDGRTPTAAGVPSPLIHDREPALALARRWGVLGPDELPDDLAVRVEAIQKLPGWCQPDKARAMARLVLDEKPTQCVEIGVFGGRSLLAQALGLKQNGRGVIYGIDPWTRVHSLEGNQFGDKTHEAWSDDELTRAYAGLLAATVAFDLAPHVRFLCGPSQHVAGVFGPGTIDVLHIDGNHSTEAATRDVRLWLPLVKPGGWIWFDDTDWESVRPALNLLTAGGCRVVRDNGNWRLYRVRPFAGRPNVGQ